MRPLMTRGLVDPVDGPAIHARRARREALAWRAGVNPANDTFIAGGDPLSAISQSLPALYAIVERLLDRIEALEGKVDYLDHVNVEPDDVDMAVADAIADVASDLRAIEARLDKLEGKGP